MSSSTPSKRIKACTTCRQLKIRCDYVTTHPKPCSRCARLGKHCEISGDFKRQGTGITIRTLMGEVEELKKELKSRRTSTDGVDHDHDHDPRSAGTEPSSVSTLHSGLPVADGLPLPVPGDGHAHSVPDTGTAAITPQQIEVLAERSEMTYALGPVTLSALEVEELALEFMHKYLPLLPVIPSVNAAELYSMNPLLLWAVVLAASLSLPTNVTHKSLAPEVIKLALQTCIIETPRSIHIVQALLILTMWSYLWKPLIEDPSLRLFGLAKTLAMQIGLHRSRYATDFPANQVRIRGEEVWKRRAWLGCFYVDSVTSCYQGLPPSIKVDYSINQSIREDSSLPPSYRSILKIMVFHHKMVEVVANSVATPTGLSEPEARIQQLKILEIEYKELHNNLEQPIADEVEMQYLLIYIELTVFAVLPDIPYTSQLEFEPSAINASCAMLLCAERILTSTTHGHFLRPVYRTTLYAAVHLFRISVSRFACVVDLPRIRSSMLAIYRLYSTPPPLCKNEWATTLVRNKMTNVFRILNETPTKHPKLLGGGIVRAVKTRLGGCVLYDSVYWTRVAEGKEVAGYDATAPDSNAPFLNGISYEPMVFDTLQPVLYNNVRITNLDLPLPSLADGDFNWTDDLFSLLDMDLDDFQFGDPGGMGSNPQLNGIVPG